MTYPYKSILLKESYTIGLIKLIQYLKIFLKLNFQIQNIYKTIYIKEIIYPIVSHSQILIEWR